jgi:hypothetical protein
MAWAQGFVLGLLKVRESQWDADRQAALHLTPIASS